MRGVWGLGNILVAGVGLLELEIARGSRDGQGAVNGPK